MSFADIIRTFFEFAAVILLILGFINEKKIIKFERALWIHIKLFFRNISERGIFICTR
jgi:hypothetical protein